MLQELLVDIDEYSVTFIVASINRANLCSGNQRLIPDPVLTGRNNFCFHVLKFLMPILTLLPISSSL